MIPIFKKSDKLNPASYRSILLIPIFRKVLEFCIKSNCTTILLKAVSFEEQFGFLSGLNTSKAVEAEVENVFEKLEHKSICSALLIDLTNASDSISHELFVEKLQ